MGNRRSLKLELNAAGKSLGRGWVEETVANYTQSPEEKRAFQYVQTYLKLGKSLDKQLQTITRQYVTALRRWEALGQKYGFTSARAEKAFAIYAYKCDAKQLVEMLAIYYDVVYDNTLKGD